MQVGSRAKKSEVVVARIEPDLLERIKAIADEEDRSVSAVVRRLLGKALQEPVGTPQDG